MKLLLIIVCWLTAVFCFYFPFSYFHASQDRKEVKVSHILVDSEDKAKEIKQNILDKKITFEQAALEQSKCPSAKFKGDIGYNMRGRLDKKFENIAFKLKKHQISEPVNSENGWHILKVTDIKYFSDKDAFIRRY